MCRNFRRALRPGGVLLVSIRDYDEALRERPSGDVPRRFATEAGERIVFQVWDWLSDDRYALRHFIMDGGLDDWNVTERRTTYRALSRAALSDALGRAGFEDVVWRMPEETGFYQPIVAARAVGDCARGSPNRSPERFPLRGFSPACPHGTAADDATHSGEHAAVVRTEPVWRQGLCHGLLPCKPFVNMCSGGGVVASGRMRLCLMIEGQEGVTWPQWIALADACERSGLEGLFRSDHYRSVDDEGPALGSLDAWTTLAGLAACTERIRLGTMVSPTTFRPPVGARTGRHHR